MNNDKYGNIEPFEFWFSFLERSISFVEVDSNGCVDSRDLHRP